MKNIIAAIILFLFIVPSFAPMMPDNLMRIVHKAQEMHHGIDTGHHHGEHHQHDTPSHSMSFDIVTYFDEVLHLDLKQASQADFLSQTSAISLDISFDPAYIILATAAIVPDEVKRERIQPDFVNRLAYSDKTPVYLSTQRMRI
jgi:hypothetical protein